MSPFPVVFHLPQAQGQWRVEGHRATGQEPLMACCSDDEPEVTKAILA